MPEPTDPKAPPAKRSAAAGKFPPAIPARRCLRCLYVLDYLPTPQCPECGLPFDPADPQTYLTKPPFVWWRYWAPGVLLAVAVGLVSYAVLIPIFGFGWSATLAVPVSVGGAVGYGVSMRRWTLPMFGMLAMLCVVGGAASAGAAGVFCGLILTVMSLVPIGVGVIAGLVLRDRLRVSRWEHRHWLPIVLLLLFPQAVLLVEMQLPRSPGVSVETTRVIDAPLRGAWDGVMFYEEVTHEPPWLLRLGLRTPLRTVGRIDRIGDRKVCVYTRGHLTKQATAIKPMELLEFAVVEQDMFEDYSVRLTGGSFRFSAVDATHTKVTLTTRYEPLLHPRWAWRPVEEHVVHTLHEHVLEGMASEAARQSTRRLAAAVNVADDVEVRR